MRHKLPMALAVAAGMTAAMSGAVLAGDVKMPNLSGEMVLGKALFDNNCAQCHGASLTGTDKGPPFIHPFYRPGHHSDGAFLLAVRTGVRQHHWHFGNMKPVEGLTDANVGLIVKYVRAVQKANGVF